MGFYIDAFSHCNLRCPSCPVANLPGNNAQAKGLLTADLLSKILEKALAETEVTSVGLFNWTEPMLNPDLPDLVRLIKAYGQWAAISTNLNVLRSADDLFRAGLDWLRVSLSGFHQDVYVRGHANGDIEAVKANMRQLAEARARTGAGTDMEVFFHRYKDNQEDEALMKSYAESLGFRFVGAWAYMMPVEKVLASLDPGAGYAEITDGDRALMARLALPVPDAVAIAEEHDIVQCDLMDGTMSLDVDGNIYLCCAASGRESNLLGNYLEMSLDEIQARKRSHSLCGPCMNKGLPVLFNHADPRFEELGQRERAGYGAAETRTAARG